MTPASFPDRSRTCRRAPITPDVATLRRVSAAALLAVAALVTALVLADVASGWALLVAAAALVLAPLTRWGFGLLETVAPLPDVHTPHVPPAAGDLVALAVAVGVTRHVLVEGDDTPTTAIPQVTP